MLREQEMYYTLHEQVFYCCTDAGLTFRRRSAAIHGPVDSLEEVKAEEASRARAAFGRPP